MADIDSDSGVQGLHASMGHLVAILEATTDYVSTADPDGHLLYINEAGRRMLGISLDERIETLLISSVHPAWAYDIVNTHGIPTARHDGVWNGETALLTRAGVEIPVSQVIIAHKSPDGVLQYFSTIARDISDRLNAEKGLRRMAAIVESSDDAMVSSMPDGTIDSWNKGAQRIYGYTAEEAIGQPYSILIPPDRIGEIVELREKLQRGEGWDHYETVRMRKDGRVISVSLTMSPINDSTGRSVGVATIARDITARKQEEENTRLANAYNRSLIEANIDPLVTIGPDGSITDVNTATEQITGYPRQQLIGADFSDYFTEPERARAGYQQVFREGSVRDYPLEVRHRNGRVTSVLYNASVYRDEDGKVIGVFAAARDVTERKRTEEIIQHQAREILEISTPVVQLWEGVLGLPLIGTLDSQRTQQIMERLLTRIVETGSPIAIIDLTGVPTVDSETGRHLIETVTAVQLLGTQTLLTGIRPEIAQTLVHLGINLGNIVTRPTLSAGLRYALDTLSYKVTRAV